MAFQPAHFSARQLRLLEKLRTREPKPDDIQRILPKGEHDPSVLSFGQHRLWVLDQILPGSPLYNVPVVLRVVGSLNISALRQSLTEIVRRHKILRTRYLVTDGIPVPVADGGPFELEFYDRESFSPAQDEKSPEERINAEVNRCFDLERGPILRASLHRLESDVHVLVLMIHHIAFDDWSASVLSNELNMLYGAFCEGAPSPLEELPIQYEDFAAWQRKRLHGSALESQLGYWSRQLAGIPAALVLPSDFGTAAPASHRGASLSCVLSATLTRRIRELSQSENASVFMALLASFQLLLHRYSGQSTVVVGTPIVNRGLRETEALIGFFGNTLPLRSDFSGELSFRQFLRKIRATTLDAFANQDLPFERIVQELNLDRNLKEHPVFQVMFAMQNRNREAFTLPGIRIGLMKTESPWAKFILHLLLTEQADGMTGSLRYSTDLFREETISAMLENWQCLLQGIVRNPDERASLQPLLAPSQREQLLTECHGETALFPGAGCIHELFERQAESTPDNVAMITERETLSYRELNARSNRLARHLLTLNVGPESRMGLCIERSAEMIIAILAILKAGAAYVPLDPDYPANRLEYMITDSAVEIVLTQQKFGAGLTAYRITPVFVDTVPSQVSHCSSENLNTALNGDNLAYVIYTSGSAGRPKGAMNSHRSVRNRLLWMQEYIPLTGDDRVLQKTPVSFDVSVWEIFYPLLSGSQLVLARPEGHRDGKYLKDLIAQQKITLLHFVPSMLAAFLEGDGLDQCGSVKHVVCSGEALTWEIQERFCERLSAKLYNFYGPTETAVEVSYWQCKSGGHLHIVPIGRPIANLQMFVLDEELQLVPRGVHGELYIGGAGVGRGYWNQPQLTADRFIPHPFRQGERLYRTGDLGRRLSGGAIEYLGRIDHQIKLRGFRIEPGEIEAVLREYPAIREAVVAARTDETENRQLVAYLIAASASIPAIADLKAFLRQKLPEYMVPAVFIFLDSYPLLASGKIDRQALPTPTRSEPDAEPQLPRDALEAELCGIWREVLQRTNVGIDQSFFAVGGNSLLAIHLVSRIKKRFGHDVPVSVLFQFSTVQEMALFLRRNVPGKPEPTLVPIQPSGAKPPFFCVHAVGGNVLNYAGLARSLGSDQPFYGLQARGLDGTVAPLTDLFEMAACYVNEIRTVRSSGPYFLGGWSLGGLIAYEMARQLSRQGQKVDVLALIDSAPFDHGEATEESGAQVDQLIQEWLPHLMIEIDLTKLSGLSEEQQLTVILESGKKTQRLPADFSEEQARTLLRIFRANLRARNHYVAKPYSGPVIFFRSRERGHEANLEMEQAWQKLCGARLQAHEIPGNHFTMLTRPDSLHLLSTVLSQSMEASLRRRESAEAATGAPSV